ncbi:MAG: sortase [Candidatus Saccharibacteria bacterium]|nr:sortase [Candidatus Saccharibacteria bacterium]
MKNDDTTNQPDNKDRAAAANIIRDDLDRIYSGNDAPHAKAEQEIRAKQAEAPNENVTTEPGVHNDYTEQWKNYHNSWSSYYQQYYERYYLNHLHRVKQRPTQTIPSETGAIGSSEPKIDSQEDQAVNELRDQLLGTVKDRAVQVKKSRHYAPIMTAVVFALVFLFLQYNQFIFATVHAYVSPGSIDPQNIILDPSGSTKVGPEPKLIIPKINVEAPMIYGINPLDNNSVEDHLRDGVVHYPIASAASVPGQNGATTILGHSSMDVFDDGKYKFVFVQLSKLDVGDNFYINYQGTRYTYSVTKKEIIDPKDIAKVTPPDSTKPSVILITCDPPGTALRRLLVFADQVSPDPTKAQKADTNKQQGNTNQIRGYSPSTLERLFGIR